ncbi:uncharacterized protein LOC115274586 [Suricata suricatta]|uniref:uncharacterized protein LOC115274586 n=1 Tax=Suricata suricatta TaxID=37032 RepID=UPI0011555F54|nr:uncharacterized protein LOC115274586 [Suricata suricatta]
METRLQRLLDRVGARGRRRTDGFVRPEPRGLDSRWRNILGTAEGTPQRALFSGEAFYGAPGGVVAWPGLVSSPAPRRDGGEYSLQPVARVPARTGQDSRPLRPSRSSSPVGLLETARSGTRLSHPAPQRHGGGGVAGCPDTGRPGVLASPGRPPRLLPHLRERGLGCPDESRCSDGPPMQRGPHPESCARTPSCLLPWRVPSPGFSHFSSGDPGSFGQLPVGQRKSRPVVEGTRCVPAELERLSGVRRQGRRGGRLLTPSM